MKSRSIGTFILDHKLLCFNFTVSFVLSIAVLGGALTLALYSGKPSSPSPVNPQSVQAVITPAAEKVISAAQDLTVFEPTKPANLSPAQWREVQSTILFIVPNAESFQYTEMLTRDRRNLVMRMKDLIYAHYEQLSAPLKSDWQLLMKNELTGWFDGGEVHKVRDKFFSDIPTVGDIQSVLKTRKKYQSISDEIELVNRCIDHLVPSLNAWGIPTSQDAIVQERTIPETSIERYLALAYRGTTKPHAAPLPPMSLTEEQLEQQLKGPPLSVGSTAAERAK